MNRHDEAKKVLEALRSDAAQHSADDSVIEMALATFRGRRRWYTALVWTMTLVWSIGAVYCAVRFFDAATTQGHIAWASGFLTCMMAVVALKMWAWMDMIHTTTMRELKRVEAAMVRLAEAVDRK